VPTYVLVHSPLVGPATWQPVAAELRHLGFPVEVPALTPPIRLRPPYLPTAIVEVVAAVRGSGHAGDDAVVLAGHSGAGPRLPAIGAALARAGFPVVATVFVDAGLPLDGQTPREAAPPAFTDLLAALTDDHGRLPRWSDWWDPAPELPAAVVAELEPVPAALFDEPLPVPPAWAAARAAYLAFTYDTEADDAESRGWPVERMAGDHLALVTDPAAVAAAIVRLAAAVATR
jgi:hypothetical protein